MSQDFLQHDENVYDVYLIIHSTLIVGYWVFCAKIFLLNLNYIQGFEKKDVDNVFLAPNVQQIDFTHTGTISHLVAPAHSSGDNFWMQYTFCMKLGTEQAF